MCTVTYVPAHAGGFILTHSRDDKTTRPAAHPPAFYDLADRLVLYPQDPQSLGTWIASGTQPRPITVCLLNGGFAAHLSKPPYRHSRGLVIPHFFGYVSVSDFVRQYPFAGIEPFTLLVAESGKTARGRLTELRWTGQRVALTEKDPHRPHIWSSATLYSDLVRARRIGWFTDWYRHHPNPTPEAIRQFHQIAGDGDPANSLRMNRNNEIMTLSLTCTVHVAGAIQFSYEDFAQSAIHQQTLLSAYAIR